MPHRLSRLVRSGVLACALALGISTTYPAAPVLAGVAHPAVVSERPVAWTPHVLNGAVKDIVEVGDTVVVGGNFNEVSDPGRNVTVRRDYVFAFERGTGRILDDFAPRLNGQVVALATDGRDVFVGGGFTQVNGQPQRGVTKLSLNGGRQVPGFAGTTLDDGLLYSMELGGGHLYIGGSFRRVNGERRVGVARLDGSTGAVDPNFDVPIARERRGSLRVQEMALSPAGDRLVINGTFLEVAGQRRPQIAMIDTARVPARLSAWSTEGYAADCDSTRTATYMRGMDFAPDGSYFAVVTTGAAQRRPGLCKTAARWEVADRSGARPTWINHTGGDSLYSVAVTGAAVYVGGHQRWLDNPQGNKFPGPGAVARQGIGAIDPRSGLALPWNPGRDRGHGVEALTPVPGGLYVGSDTEILAGEYRARLGMFPLR